MCNFRVGQKVVCVDGEPFNGHSDDKWPKAGGVYTVRDVLWCDFYQNYQIRLVEIVNPRRFYMGAPGRPYLGYSGPVEAAFGIHRFRPVVERKTDISIFKRMLNPSKQLTEA